jgi:hypothetical protein
MVIAVLTAGKFLIKAGVGRHINLASQDGFDAGILGSPIKINGTVHNAMVSNGSTVHAQLFHTGHIFFYFVGTVQKGVFCVDVKVCKCHGVLLFF